jgi:hypothetical protein
LASALLAWRWREEIVDLAIRRDSSATEVLWLSPFEYQFHADSCIPLPECKSGD